MAVDSLSHAITSYTVATNKTWPFVTVSNFEVLGEDVTKMAGVVSVTFSPLVSEVEREGYEIFTANNQEWIAEGVLYSTGESLPQDAKGIPTQIYHLDETNVGTIPWVEDSSGPFLPVWQTAPAPYDPRVVNFNLLSAVPLAVTFEAMLNNQETVISQAVPHTDIFREISTVEVPNTPYSVVLGPLYDKLSPQDTKLVTGTVAAVLDWNSFFGAVLSIEERPVVLVMDGSCGDIMSFQVSGHEVQFLGYDDLHDPDYTHMEYTTLLDPSSPNHTENQCIYELRMYPTDELEQIYRTPQPYYYAVVMLLVFAFATAMFLVYATYVERRQTKVLESAAKSAAIVHSLFPKNVTDRMMKDLEQKTKGKDASGNYRFSAKTQMKDFLQDSGEKSTNSVAVYDTKPIADLFPACTVLFGDIVGKQLLLCSDMQSFVRINSDCTILPLRSIPAGFTAWSSVRGKLQVPTNL
jgi:hypothetical protein